MEQNKLFEFFSNHWSKLLLGVLAIACIAVWTERYLGSSRSQSTQDFLAANKIFEQVLKGELLASESLDKAEAILSRHPELHPKYDSLLALTFFAQSNAAKGMHYARCLIDHADKQLPSFYHDYATASLLISEKEYAKAFEAAACLQAQLSEKADYQMLDAMNTLRLVFLADALGRPSDKKAYFERLEKHPQYGEIQSLFQEGDLSLADYIKG